jgi:hypothetical protein
MFLHLLRSCSQGASYTNVKASLPPVEQGDDSLDYAIENGNWEQVAASAAALVEMDM